MSTILSTADLRGGDRDGDFDSSDSLSSVTSIVFRILKLLEPSWITTDFFFFVFVLLLLLASDFLDSLLTEDCLLKVLPPLAFEGDEGVFVRDNPLLKLKVLPASGLLGLILNLLPPSVLDGDAHSESV